MMPVEEDNEEEFPDVNEGITGKYIVDLIVTFEDGTQQRVTDMEQSLSVYWQSQPIESVEYVLEVQATTDGSVYDRVEFSFLDLMDSNDFTVMMTAEDTVERSYTATSASNRVLPLDNTQTELWSQDIPLKSLLEDELDGVYTIVFETLYGAPRYRGLGTVNESDWVTISRLPTVSFDVEISSSSDEGTTDKDIQFDSDVSFY